MKKSTTLNKTKLTSYTAFAGAIVAGSAANAQITYTDVNPDAVADSLNPFAIDFNNDATPDLAFGVQHISGSFTNSGQTLTYVGAFAYAVAPAGKIVTIDTLQADTLNCGVAISQASNFGNASFGSLALAALIQPINYPFASGPYIGVNDKYLGFQFTLGTNTHYGWARLSVAADATTITIKEYAYNATPSGAINTCQTAGIEDVAVENKVTIKPLLDEAIINVTPDLVGGTLAITNLAGQTVKTVAINDVNAKISYEGLNTGIYFVEARFESGSVNKKVYVK